ncbi:MAG: hypothetical protein JJ896_14230 [Rhodothermales bacterium]|nr:hypothetical protein [Rhodothermales bacterium]MBO6780807.1 hypothetical protein [Rhodothermales bacterium]
MTSSPGCWACFGEILAREYSDLDYHEVHRLTVDTYAVQHPGTPSPQSIRSVALHGIRLCAILERDLALRDANEVMKQKAAVRSEFTWLTPPDSLGAITVLDVVKAANADEHSALVWSWARSVWDAWSPHHDTFRAWLDRA